MRAWAPTALAALVLTGAAAGRARAGAWPQPAMGGSRSGEPELILSFDDGPHPIVTPKILDMLAAHDIHAVFFWVGWHFQRAPEASKALAERAIAEGHVIANHTINHAQLCAVPEAQAAFEIDGNRAMLEQAATMPVVWFRSPYGARCSQIERLLAERGMHNFHWDLDPQEWRKGSQGSAIRYVTHNLAFLGDKDRAVLLLHDTKRSTLTALPKILDWITAENKKREVSGRKPIVIVPASELAAEQVNHDLLGWLAVVAGEAGDDVLGGLASSIP